ncbi:MAG: Uma2 family endonuclease [Hydrogenothermaceae bacterium]|nr:Uma2 family endonuclease [Hydrogenothermaceae bacterium]
MSVTVKTERKKKSKQKKSIPNYLVYEVIDGKKIYYRDYKKVVSGELEPEAVMGSSDLQGWIISTVVGFLFKSLDSKKYMIMSGEVGYHYNPAKKRNWVNLDIAIVSKEKLKKPEGSYLKVPPEVVIEVDTKADLSEMKDEYYILKTNKLLKSGVKKVIWIFTKYKKVMIAQEDKDWLITDWNKDVEVMDNIYINIENLLKD